MVQKKKQGKAWSIQHGREVDVGGEALTARSSICSIPLQDSRHLHSQKYLTDKKPAFKLSAYIFEYWPHPHYVHLASTHVMNVSRPFPFFMALLLPWEAWLLGKLDTGLFIPLLCASVCIH